MNLEQYPTPETDDSLNGAEMYASELLETSRDLERRLAACREFIQDSIDMGHFEELHIEAAKEILERTKP